MERIIWLYTNKKSKYDVHFNLLKECEVIRSIQVPPVVNLKDGDSETTKYYLARLQEEYEGYIFIVDNETVFI